MSAPESPLLRWAPLLVILLAWVAHAGVRQAGWVLDDVRLVRDDPDIARGPSAIPRMFSKAGAPDELESGAYGPVTRASFALEAPLWQDRTGGFSPRGFHLTNLLLHGLCALLLLRVLLLVFPGRSLLAFGGAVCFAVHPIHTGTVSSLMGRAELLAALFALLATWAWLRTSRNRISWLPIACLCWWLSLLSKELALGLPLAWWLLDRVAPREEEDHVPLWGWASLAIPLGLFFVLWPGIAAPGFDLPAQGLGDRLLVGFEGLGRMAMLLVLPIGLRADYSDETVPNVGYVVEGFGWIPTIGCLLLVVLALARVVRGRAGLPSWSWTLMLSLAIPALVVLPAGVSLEPRFAYVCALPLFAIAGRLAEALLRMGSGSPAFAAMRAGLVGAVTVVCMIGLTHQEARAWKDDEALHQHLLEQNPRHVRAMVRIARSHRLTANEKRQLASLLPSRSPQRQRLLEERRDALTKGLAWARRAVTHELGGRSADALRELGFLLLAKDDSAGALRALERAQQADPVLQKSADEVRRLYPPERLESAAELYMAIGRARESLGSPAIAADAYLMASRLDPARNDYRTRAGLGLCRVNRYGEGLTLLHEALRRSRHPQEREEIERSIENAQESARRLAAEMLRKGEVQQEKSRMRDAVTFYERAVEIDPTSIEGWIRAGWLRGEHFGDYTRAQTYFKRAEKLLEQAGAQRSDPTWKRITGYRTLLKEQKAQEDAEEARLLDEERKRLEQMRKDAGG